MHRWDVSPGIYFACRLCGLQRAPGRWLLMRPLNGQFYRAPGQTWVLRKAAPVCKGQAAGGDAKGESDGK